MGQSLSELRWVENELLFRRRNKEVLDNVADTKAIAKEEGEQGHKAVKNIDDIELLFYCECSDEKCRQRIALTPKEFIERHSNNSRFILIPGHQRPEVERTVYEGDRYVVVEKYIAPPSA